MYDAWLFAYLRQFFNMPRLPCSLHICDISYCLSISSDTFTYGLGSYWLQATDWLGRVAVRTHAYR